MAKPAGPIKMIWSTCSQEISETTTDGFPGPVTIKHRRESHGRRLNSGVGQLMFDEGMLAIKRLRHGDLKGDLIFGDNFGVELTCQLFATIHPVAGVSN